jgi:hypothetical protein
MNNPASELTAILYSYSSVLRGYRLTRRCSVFDLASELGIPLRALTDIEQRNVSNVDPEVLQQWIFQIESLLGPSAPLAPPVPPFLRGGAK